MFSFILTAYLLPPLIVNWSYLHYRYWFFNIRVNWLFINDKVISRYLIHILVIKLILQSLIISGIWKHIPLRSDLRITCDCPRLSLTYCSYFFKPMNSAKISKISKKSFNSYVSKIGPLPRWTVSARAH